MRRLELVAAFMICLVVSIPFLTADALASVNGDIRSAIIRGNDDVNFITSDFDHTNVDVEVKLGTEIVDNSNVYLGSVPFNGACIDLGDDYYRCEYRSTYKTTYLPGQSMATVYLKDDEGNVVDQQSMSFVADGKGPTVKSLSVSPTVISSENVIATVSLIDEAKDGMTDACSGIDTVRFYVGTDLISSYDFDSRPCEYSAFEIELDANKFGGSGEKEFCAMGTDVVGKESEKYCIDVTVDKTAPSIRSASLFFYDDAGELVRYIPEEKMEVLDMKVNISDDGSGIDTSKVFADLSELTGDDGRTHVGADSCDVFDGDDGEKIYVCSWNDVTVFTSGYTSIIIEMTDKGGNTKTQTLSTGLSVDATSPSIISIETNHDGGEDFYIGETTTFMVKMTETGAGFEGADIDPNLNGISGELKAPATYCEPSWICYWENVSGTTAVHEAAAVIAVFPTSKDDAGNQVTGVVSEIFKIDLESPVLHDVTVTNQEGFAGVKSGDTITIRAELDETTSALYAQGNFSSIIDGADTLSATCIYGINGGWNCTWEDIGPVKAGYIEEIIPMTFMDAGGNSVEHEEELIIHKSLKITADYWTLEGVQASPARIDRHTMGLVNSMQYVKVNLVSSDSSVAISDVLFAGCVDELDLIKDAEIVAGEGTTTPYLKLTYEKTTVSDDVWQTEAICGLGIQSKVGTDTLVEIEPEEIPFNIEIYNMPFGSIDAKLQDKIDDKKDSWIVQMTWLDAAKQILDLARTICNILAIVETISAVIGAFKDLVQCLADIPVIGTALQGVAKALGALSIGSDNMLNVIYTKVKQFTCGIGSCSILPTLINYLKGKMTDESGPGDEETLSKDVGDMISKVTDEIGRLSESNILVPKNSLILSVLTLCVPGIIYNLHKYREIECQYIKCLEDNVPNGMPISMCDSYHEYAQCKFVYNEIFNLIPFASLIGQISQALKAILTNPLILVGILGGLLCGTLCQGACGMCTACRLVTFVQRASSLYNSVLQLMDPTSMVPQGSICMDVLGEGGLFEDGEFLPGVDENKDKSDSMGN